MSTTQQSGKALRSQVQRYQAQIDHFEDVLKQLGGTFPKNSTFTFTIGCHAVITLDVSEDSANELLGFVMKMRNAYVVKLKELYRQTNG